MQGNHSDPVTNIAKPKLQSKEPRKDSRHATDGSRKIKDTNKHLDENLMHNQPYMEDIILKTLAE